MEKINYFARLENDKRIGLYNLPSLEQYDARVNNLRSSGIPDSEIAIEAQRDWHSRGQNGCNFARIAARKAVEIGWQSHYVPTSRGAVELSNLDEVMEAAELDDQCEIMSIIFEPMQPIDLLDTITRLTEESQFYLEKDELIDNETNRQMFLRYPLKLGSIAAWSMCFAPYDFMPNTRRSPYIEIATRMKDKPNGLHEMLNQKADEAHLADLIIDKDPKHTGRRILNTIARTESILGEKPNHITAAKSTLTIPSDVI